jgi:hypothetical protein
MSKRAIIDEDLPRAIDKILEDLGWEVKDIRDIGLRGKNDKEIIDFAQETKKAFIKLPLKNLKGYLIIIEPGRIRIRKG